MDNYKGTLDEADKAYIYYNPHALALKKLQMLDKQRVKQSFGDDSIVVVDNSDELFYKINEEAGPDTVYLFMSSGDFDGYDLVPYAEELIKY